LEILHRRCLEGMLCADDRFFGSVHSKSAKPVIHKNSQLSLGIKFNWSASSNRSLPCDQRRGVCSRNLFLGSTSDNQIAGRCFHSRCNFLQRSAPRFFSTAKLSFGGDFYRYNTHARQREISLFSVSSIKLLRENVAAAPVATIALHACLQCAAFPARFKNIHSHRRNSVPNADRVCQSRTGGWRPYIPFGGTDLYRNPRSRTGAYHHIFELRRKIVSCVGNEISTAS